MEGAVPEKRHLEVHSVGQHRAEQLTPLGRGQGRLQLAGVKKRSRYMSGGGEDEERKERRGEEKVLSMDCEEQEVGEVRKRIRQGSGKSGVRSG